ncbi:MULTISPECIES: MFS transporter [unclassified Chelatococcus]|jgi:MFS family permease|uniref:MFS transporter n=1 Tax=unclassified Chelatococcus TaxID=2638111 RepID=UPI001BCAE7C2|nr:MULTISPECIES: MFS transporter [unclassified Chelatococcus]CAH1668622.1 putative MFS family arabinose efflux permease [Hyphomicrobiales bacterium]MBS7739433.1 MFS transporter [Chelatococcus sp. HY11]MBX3543802.1 MFS transporter [Chelatococcus sp.]MCO5076031.1 MFS transporter [Chelatococcus sp.]CAH1679913.1 putative MFS family arabinose efflux permease [Hyphomicrobiales bacterium]
MADAVAPRPLTRGDAKTLALASLGGALEFYDFIIYVFFAVVIGKLFFPPDMPEWLEQLQTFGIFAAGYLARPLGGIILAHFGDKTGRKRMFTLSIFMMALPTLIIGVLPTYESIGYAAPLLLLVMRVFQGAAIGGEAPGAWVFVSEHVPQNRVGLACGLLTGGLTGGILLGSLMATLINYVYTPGEIHDFAWRLPFILGGVFGFVAMYLRRWLHETPVFEAMRARKALVEDLPLKQVLRGYRPAVVVSMLVTWMLTAIVVVVILMTPTLMQRLHGLPALTTLVASIAATLGITLSAFAVGAFIDRFGLVKVTLAGGPFFIITAYALYMGTAINTDYLIPLSALAGLGAGLINVVPYTMVRAFPDNVRFTGVSFSYNVAYAIFGGLTPVAVQLLLVTDPIGPIHYVAGATVIGVVAIVAYMRRPALVHVVSATLTPEPATR